MTSHETALEAARKAFGNSVTAPGSITVPTFSPMEAFDAGWHAAFASTLSPDVSGLVERLKAYVDMRLAAHLSECDDPLWPIPHDVQIAKDTIAALASLSLQLAAVEGERDQLRTGIKRLSDEEELCAETTGDDPFSLVYLAAKLAAATERRDAAELALGHEIQIKTDLVASLSAAQEENERLLKVLAMSVAVDTAKFCGKIVIVHPDMPAHYWDGERMHRMDTVPLHPSKEDKTDG